MAGRISLTGLNGRAVLQITGFVSIIIALAMLPPLAIAIGYQEKQAAFGFGLTIALSLILGGLIVRHARPLSTKLGVREGMLIVSLCWIVASGLSALAYVLSGAIPDFADAVFESASGFTTTGATIMPDIESVSKGALFWRSFTNWLGGMGILVFAVALLPALGIKAFWIAESESPGPTFDKLTPKLADTARVLYLIYLGMSVVETSLLMAGGMSLYDALVHMFSSMGTGGFSSYNNSVAHFNSLYLELVLCFFMFASGCNYNLYYLLLKGRWREYLADEELRLFAGIVGATTLGIALILRSSGTVAHFGEALRQSVFQTVSIITTTGFATADFDLWPDSCRFWLFLLMFLGGCASSTSGAIKIVRVVVFFKMIRRGIYKWLHPLAVVPVKLNGKNLSADTVSGIAAFIFLYFTFFLAGTTLVTLENVDLVTAASTVATCLGNVGPGLALTGPTANFSLYSPATTLFLSFVMITGRLELFTMLLIFTPSFWRPNR